VPLAGNVTTGKPRRALVDHVLSLPFNAFGGVIRWVAAPGEEIETYGSVAHAEGTVGGEFIISAFTGSPGAIGGHMIFEPS
jgi:hypothetical protein